MDILNSGDNVLIIWSNADQTSLKTFVNEIQNRTKNGSVVLENAGMITEGKHIWTQFSLKLTKLSHEEG